MSVNNEATEQLFRKLEQDEREWIGAIAIMTLIMGLALSTVIDLTKEPMTNWSKEIMAQEKPDFIEAIIWLAVYLFRVLWVVLVIQPFFILMRKFGYFENNLPHRWIKYLGTRNKGINYDH